MVIPAPPRWWERLLPWSVIRAHRHLLCKLFGHTGHDWLWHGEMSSSYHSTGPNGESISAVWPPEGSKLCIRCGTLYDIPPGTREAYRAAMKQLGTKHYQSVNGHLVETDDWP